MRPLMIAAVYLGAFLLLSACSQESGSLYSQTPQVMPEQPIAPEATKVDRQKFDWITNDGGELETDFNPRVDILFVVDNSDSMKAAQENLVKNVDRFTNEIVKNPMIDYHIGVISVWDDSERFVKTKKDSYGPGELRFLKNAAGQTATQRYVDRKTNKNVLAATLKIGVAPYAEGGPENEVFFAPLMTALEKTGHGAVNEGFFREDAQLVVIFMTDADEFDQSTIDYNQVAETLKSFKGGNIDKVSAYGVLVDANAPETSKDWGLRVHPKYHPECFSFDAKGRATNKNICAPFGPNKLESLIFKVNEKSGVSNATLRKQFIMSILSPNFGNDLANIGGDIKRKTLEKEIFLSQRPRRDNNGQYQIRVRYGNVENLKTGKGQLIPMSQKKGWLYNPETNSVKLSGDIDYVYQEGARFAVDIVPVQY